MTFHDFMKSVVEHIDERATGLHFINEDDCWIVGAESHSYSYRMRVNKKHSETDIVDAGKQTARHINEILFWEEV